MKSLFNISAVLLILAVCSVADTTEVKIGGLDGLNPASPDDSLSVRLAISGGGARGLTVIGVLRAFEERGIGVSAITGTSFGAVLGGLYACGYDSEDLAGIFSHLDTRYLLSNAPRRSSMFLTKRQGRDKHLLSVRFDGIRPKLPQGYTSGQEISSLLTSLTSGAVYRAGGDFTRLPIPFRTVATDVVTGDRIVLESGSLADAMRATIAYPLAFTGVEVESLLLMDGGMVAPVPVDLVLQMGDPDQMVVAINTTSPLMDRRHLRTPVDIAGQVTSIMTADKLAAQLAMADLVIEPCSDAFTATDFKHYDTLVELGYTAGLHAAGDIARRCSKREASNTRRVAHVEVLSTNRGLADRLTAGLIDRIFSRDGLVRQLKKITLDHNLLSLTAEIAAFDTPTPGSEDTTQKITITLEPINALPWREMQLSFDGNTIFDDSLLAAQFHSEDSTIDAIALRRIRDRLLGLYRSRGYDLAEVSGFHVSRDHRTLSIRIEEARIERIDVRGNRRTRDWLVRSYFTLKRGDPYSSQEAAQGIRHVYATDLFDRVTLDVTEADRGAVVEIQVLEKNFTQARIGWHWHDEYESEQFLDLLDDNVLGMGVEFLVHGQYGNDRKHASSSLQAHRIFSTYLTARARLFYNRMNRVVFDATGEEAGRRREDRFGGLFGIGQQIARFGTVSGVLRFEKLQQTDLRTGNKSTVGLSSLRLQSLVETFDRIPFPETGKKHLFEITLAGKALGGDVQFTRFRTSLEAYFPVNGRINYHPRLTLGISRTGLPAPERFFIGGHDSFAGFRSDQLTGDKMILLNQEIRLKLPLYSYLLLRYDIGEVYGSADQIKLRNLRHGLGFSIAVATPIGPFEIGYGVADKDTDRVYFNAGFAF
ncbi:MAG: BamA/TamA family outer membrane protein [Candidatus Zixiibacteriota bacterium]|nr:MAG: BamA/TamA family outer membrane protein [candidate division Zixibacteria bacterium]